MKIVAFSDTHGLHRNMKVPEGDLLICAGDFTVEGRGGKAESFFTWLADRTADFTHGALVVAGNHDMCLDAFRSEYQVTTAERACALSGVQYLQDEAVEIGGLKFYGSPWTPRFGDWAFMLPRTELVEVWAQIPDDTNVLITHGPPRGLGDRVIPTAPYGEKFGCQALAERVAQLDRLRLHVFGHIHGSGGFELSCDETTFANVAVLDEAYRLVREPRVFEVQPAGDSVPQLDPAQRSSSTAANPTVATR